MPRGGTADTWYDDDVHGSFRVKNAGDVYAYIYVTAEQKSDGPMGPGNSIEPTSALPTFDKFAVAAATNPMDLLPTWNLLNVELLPDLQGGRVLGQIFPGEYILFDLKFYAPMESPVPDARFRIGFYALPSSNPSMIPGL